MVFRVILAFGLAFVLGSPGAWARSIQNVLPGAQPQGMGNAFTAVARGLNGIFFNPAGLAAARNIEIAGSIGRVNSDSAAASVFLGYSRPLLFIPDATISLGYCGQRHTSVVSKDTFLLSWAVRQEFRKFPLPVKLGVSARFMSARTPSRSRFRVGVDAGAMIEVMRDWAFGAAVTNLDTDVGLPGPAFSVGAAYNLARRIVFSTDVRIEGGDTVIYPGLEASFYSGLLKLRAGKGVSWGGTSQLALGFGVSFSPLFLDCAMSVPIEGFHKGAGSSQISVSYRFGAPLFYRRFVGRASERAGKLVSEVETLETKKAALEGEIATAGVNRGVLETEVLRLEGRLESLRKRLRDVERELIIHKKTPAEETKKAPSRKKKRIILPVKRSPSWPKTHVVRAGDTLRSLAAKYYGDRTLWELIYKANRGKIDRGLPKIGARLVIPGPKK